MFVKNHNITLTFQGGETALVIGATLGFTKVVKLLLEKGGDPNSFDTVNVIVVLLFHYQAILDIV